MCWCGSLGFILFERLCASWTQMSISEVRKVLSYHFFNKFFVLFSLCLLGLHIMHWILSQWSFTLSSFFKILFTFCYLNWMIFLNCLQISYLLFASSNLLLILYIYIYIYIYTHTYTYTHTHIYICIVSVIVFFNSYFLNIFSISSLNFSLSSSILLLSSISIFLILSYSLYDKFLISISLSSFSEVLCFVWKIFLCLLILPLLFVCFYILIIYTILVVFKNWPYIEGILQGSVAHFPLVTKTRYFLVSLVWTVCNLFVWLGCSCWQIHWQERFILWPSCLGYIGG